MRRFNSELIEFAATVGRKVWNRGSRRSDPLLNDRYVSQAPNAQQTVDLFKGGWASKLPIEGVRSGAVTLFEDERIEWLLGKLGDPTGFDVLELGPLEGGHSYMLEKAGAKRVHGIDANTLAYLKCLTVKQLLGLEAAEFELGDFDTYLDTCEQRYDLVVACGVLYHLVDPLRTLLNMIRVSDRLFIWSHFFDPVAMPKSDPRHAWMTGEVTRKEIDGEALTYHMRSYGGTKHGAAFCGGTRSKAVWMEQNEVMELLARKGYRTETAFVTPDHPHGPAACIYAERA